MGDSDSEPDSLFGQLQPPTVVMSTGPKVPDAFWESPGAKPSPQYWSQFRTSVENYLELRAIMFPTIELEPKAEIKLIRSFLGREGIRQFDTLVPKDTATVKEVLDLLGKHFGFRQHVVTARHKFVTRKQQPGESLDAFITALANLVSECKYNTIPQAEFEQASLTQALIAGISDSQMRKRLLMEEALTWEKACEIARLRSDVT